VIHFRIHDPNALRVLNDPTLGRRWDLRSAFLVGPDAKPMRGAIEERDGHIYCESAQDAPVGIAMLVDTKSAGRLVLQTCFLPSRDEPYDLFIEIARWLIKQFVEECETWQMWNPALSGDAFAKWDAARDEFRAALRELDPVRAEVLAQRSIELGLEAGELMAIRHSSHLVARRFVRKAPSATTLGVCVDPRIAPNSANTAAARQFDVIALRTPWELIEATPGKYDWSAVDAWAKWAHSEKKALIIGPIIDFGTTNGVPNGLPSHALAARNDHQRMRALIWAQARAVAARYQQVTPLFLAASGSNCAGWHAEGIDRMIEWTRTAVVAIRDAKRDARVVVEIQSPAAESWRGVKGGSWPTAFLQKLVTENLSLTAAGVRFTQGGNADPVRDLMTIGGLLDGYIGRELPIFVTAFGVPSASTATAHLDRGAWHAPDGWTPSAQANWGEAMLRVSLARAFVEGAWWSRLQDAPGGPTDGVLDVQGRAKPVLDRLIALRRELARATSKVAASGGHAG